MAVTEYDRAGDSDTVNELRKEISRLGGEQEDITGSFLFFRKLLIFLTVHYCTVIIESD